MHLIEVKNLARAEVGTIEKHDLVSNGEEFDFPEAVNVGKISGTVTLVQLEESVAASAKMTAEVELICDRCLDNFETSVEFQFEREYVYDRKAESEEGLYVDKHLNIDLTEPIHDELLLAIPTQNFCRQDCQGICPGCGQNLNQQECLCKK